MKVRLKKNVRLFEADDSDFEILGNEVKELPEKHLRSYSIKYHLFHGLFEVVEGDTVFHMKAGLVYVAKDTLYCHEFGNYFKKDLEIDTITFIDEDEIPKDILVRINPNFEKVETPTPAVVEVKDEVVKDEIVKDEVVKDAVELDDEETKEVIDFDSMIKNDLKKYAKDNNIKLEKNMKVGEIKEYLKSLD